MKREERNLCQLPTSFLSRMRSRFSNNQWRFCHVWNNPENRFKFEREHKRLLNLSARSNFKWTNQSWGWNELASGRCISLWRKPKRPILKQIFRNLVGGFIKQLVGGWQRSLSSRFILPRCERPPIVGRSSKWAETATCLGFMIPERTKKWLYGWITL